MLVVAAQQNEFDEGGGGKREYSYHNPYVYLWLGRVELDRDDSNNNNNQHARSMSDGADIPIGAKVQVKAGVGRVRWSGLNPPFSPTGRWVGIEL